MTSTAHSSSAPPGRDSLGELKSSRLRPVALVALLLLAGCTKTSGVRPCRERGVSIRTKPPGNAHPPAGNLGSANDSVTIEVVPGWHKRIAKYGREFVEQAKPLLVALDERILSAFHPGRNGRLDGLYLALGKLLVLDSRLRDEGLDIAEPLVAKIRPASQEDAANSLKVMVIAGPELPTPNLLVQVILPSTDPSRLLRYLQHTLAKMGSCVSHLAKSGANGQMCLLENHGLVVFETSDGLVRVDLLSGDRDETLATLKAFYLGLVPKVPPLGMATLQAAAVDLSQDRSAFAVTIPGPLVEALMEVHRRSGAWSFVRSAALDGPGELGVEAELAMDGYVSLGERILALPWRLEVESTRMALELEDSVRLTLDMELTDHGSRLVTRGLQPMLPQERRIGGLGFDVDALLSVVEPIEALYFFEHDYGASVQEMSPAAMGSLGWLLQSPAAAWKTMASTMRPNHLNPRYMGSLLAKGLGLEDMSWQFTSKGGGTVMELEGSSSTTCGLDANPILRLRAWVAGNRRLRAEACILPRRFPCRQSSCSDEISVQKVTGAEAIPVNPCWEQALSELRRLLGNIAWIRFPDVEGPMWFQYAIPLHASLACAARDPRFSDEANEIDRALLRFVKQKGRLPRLRPQRKPFMGSQAELSD